MHRQSALGQRRATRPRFVSRHSSVCDRARVPTSCSRRAAGRRWRSSTTSGRSPYAQRPPCIDGRLSDGIDLAQMARNQHSQRQGLTQNNHCGARASLSDPGGWIGLDGDMSWAPRAPSSFTSPCPATAETSPRQSPAIGGDIEEIRWNRPECIMVRLDRHVAIDSPVASSVGRGRSWQANATLQAMTSSSLAARYGSDAWHHR